jgi:cell division transport system ATP-binding protein
MEIFEDLNKDGKTVIIATHDKNIVNHMKRRVIAFSDKGVMSDREEAEYNLGK